jgi:type I restriction enzyme S subunit
MGPFGSDIKTDNFVAHGVPIIRGVNLNSGRFNGDSFVYLTEEKANQLSSANAFPGDIVFTHRGTLGQVGLIPKAPFSRYVVSQSQMKLTCKASLADPLFIYYFFKSNIGRQALLVNTSQTGVPAISRPVTSLKAISLHLPSLPEQRRIAHILGTLDDKIENNRKTAKTLEAMTQAIFKSWFVDFDPVRAKMAGESRENICKRLKLTPEILDLFPDRLVDSELGEIPEGWEITTLTAMSTLNPESLTKAARPKLINYVDLSNTKWGRIESVTIYTQEDAPSRAQRILRPDDTIVGTVRPGNGSFALITENGLTGSTGFAVLRPKKTIYAAFVYLAVTAKENIQSLVHLADGGAYPAVRPEVVAATQVVKPCDESLATFSTLTSVLIRKFATIERQIRTLVALRDALLPKLISGEIRIHEAVKTTEEVLS